MSLVQYFLLFILGSIIGSYLNVVNLRYSPEKGFGASVQGKSHCPHCHQPLRWYELTPVVSFLIQRGRCRRCGEKLSLQYPVVEVLSGLTLVFIFRMAGFTPLAALWALLFLTLILISIIDLRLRVIPDKLTLFIAVVGAGIAFLNYSVSDVTSGSFIEYYDLLFTWSNNFWFNRALGVVFGFALFGLIYFLTRGRAMGFGDVKLAGALGLVLGWPDIGLALMLSFIAGSLYAVSFLITRRAAMKSALAFGPFIAIGVTLVFFFGYHILNGYFRLIGLGF